MRIINRDYELLVIDSKHILTTIKEKEIRIGEMAVKACTIKLGGHNKAGYYTLGMFSDDIGVSPKTLSCWVHNYKISKTLKDMGINERRSKELHSIRRIMQPKKGIGLTRVNKFSDKDMVLESYNENKRECEEDRNVRLMIKALGTIKFRLDIYVLKKLNQDNLSKIKSISSEILEILKKELE